MKEGGKEGGKEKKKEKGGRKRNENAETRQFILSPGHLPHGRVGLEEFMGYIMRNGPGIICFP